MKKIISVLLVLGMLTVLLASCNNDKEPDAEKEVSYTYIVNGDSTEYAIVMDDKATSAVKSLAGDLADRIKEVTGVKVERMTDDTSKYPAKAKEIVIGSNDREESKTTLSELSEVGWKIKYTGSKLVVSASNDYMLRLAYKALVEKYLIKDDTGLKVDEALDVSYSGTDDMISFLDEDGKFKYKVIFSSSATSEQRNAATNLSGKLKSIFGVKSVPVGMDTGADDPEAFEIIVGNTARQASKDLYENIGMLEMKSVVVGNKIVIGAGADNALEDAISYFLSYVSDLQKGTYDGWYAINKDYSDTKTTIEYLLGVPMIQAGTFAGSDDCGDGTHVFVWDGIEEAELEAYKAELTASGMTLENTYEMGNNKHALYKGKAANAYVSYIGGEKVARVFFEKTGTLYPSAQKAAFDTVSGYTPTLWMLDVDSQYASGEDGGANGGMSFIAKVADGSFVIVDGGYNTDAESDRILNFLKENTPAGEKPVVSAWIITHQHGDHYGALLNMTKRHLNEFTVKAFYYNMPMEGHDGASGGLVGTVTNAMSKWTGAVQYSKLHTGMRFYVADAQFDVIFTHEDLFPILNTNVNDTSMVIRMTHGGKRVMFLADIEARASGVIEKNIAKSELKSDIVQYSHHGYEGANQALYDLIEAPTILWPVNTYSFQTNNYGQNIFERMINGTWGSVNYYVSHTATYVETIICAEEAHWAAYKIELPTYTPRAEKLPDYEDLYNRVKADAEESGSNG